MTDEDITYNPYTNTYIHKPKNYLRITELWAYVSVDPSDGNEGVIGAPIPGIGHMPMVGADEQRMKSLRPFIEKLKGEVPIKLIRFTHREDIETL